MSENDSPANRERTSINSLRLSRRAALGGAAALAGLAGSRASTAVALTDERGTGKSPLVASRDNAVVAIASGRVRGYTRNGIHTFKGIPYAESTAGANRFMPPVQVKAWSGVRSSMHYGFVSPQPSRAGWKNDEEAFMFLWDDGIPNEDCLRVNVWTNTLHSNAKRPVMVWLHGGGFVAGSGQELRAYDGENLARRHDVVVVSLNHRLGALGFFDLSQGKDDRFASSGNVGMLDIVAALTWVRENIAAFGGDPSCVTIFGQSGGGGKVAALMAMPSARGLFHRAIVQSGSMLRVRTPEGAARLTEELLKELDLDRTKLANLQYMPCEQIVTAAAKLLSRQPRRPPDFRRMAEALGLGPVNDGLILPQHPFDPAAPAISADVPMLVGTNLNEFTHNINNPDGELMSDEQMVGMVKGVYGERTTRVVETFRKQSPQLKPFDIWSRVASTPVRGAAIEQCTRKAAQRAAPAYLYWFTWQTPVLDGRPRAFHCAELPFVFDNAERCESMTGGGARAIDLARRMSDAWVRFARTGNPNGTGLPNWPAFTADRVPTMLFDDRCEVRDGPDAAEQAVIATAV